MHLSCTWHFAFIQVTTVRSTEKRDIFSPDVIKMAVFRTAWVVLARNFFSHRPSIKSHQNRLRGFTVITYTHSKTALPLLILTYFLSAYDTRLSRISISKITKVNYMRRSKCTVFRPSCYCNRLTRACAVRMLPVIKIFSTSISVYVEQKIIVDARLRRIDINILTHICSFCWHMLTYPVPLRINPHFHLTKRHII